MDQNLEITKMLTISTAHISEESSEYLENVHDKLVVYDKGDYGWMIVIDDNIKDFCNTIGNSNIPSDIISCMIFARECGCDWLCLDCDGMVIDGLETYSW